MGRWLDRLRKVPEGIPTKPTKPGSVSFVSTPSGHFQKKAPVELVAVAANDPQSSAWLHLLALADGRVIQRAGNLSTARVEEEARLQYGDDLLAVVAVPGFERPLTEAEIVKALAGGTLAAPEPQPASSSVWLARVARLLGTRPAVLLEGGHLQQHDLAELAGTDASQVADTIRTSPAWLNRPQRVEQSVERIVEEEVEPQRAVHTAATASPAWREADAAFSSHLMACRACHAATGRYCEVGADLRQRYRDTPTD
ncbi:hypothetical protein [Geopseudomonas aromaticivorans]